ncbi:MAG: threonine--tRNA ligase [Candidatus Omnitrophica bacterium]|nr:threonine--tRNA ligase [Candidatus Omnitrophota bacterium]
MDYKTDLDKLRHSCSHIMAEAVKKLWPDVKVAIGPAIDTGFYYDFQKEEPFTDQDLKKIEKEMRRITARKPKFKQSFMPREEALKLFEKHGEVFKVELISGLPDKEVSLYQTGDGFVDLCKGPHVDNAGEIKAFKLLSVAGAYWRGDEHKPQLQRIYGTCFFNEEELKAYLTQLEEAQRRDHRMLGKQLDLFSTNAEIGGGLVLWHPKGALIRHLAEEFCKKEHLAAGYEFVISPHIGRAQLWETSGHLQWYQENMYSPMDIEGQDYYIKPMNCPFHIMIYKNTLRSYRDLPLRYAEWGTVYRYERGGVLHGLLRVRGFTQDDAHIFCRPDQMPQEIDRVLNFCLFILRSFGFQEFQAYLATRDPQKSAGDPGKWEPATEALRAALTRANIPYAMDEGGAAFYGPKIDLKIKDAIGREWQLSTIQFDFNLPERFNLSYAGEDGGEHRPYMIHRALMGSMERFFGVLIEHFAGAFPLWLAPTQVLIIPLREEHQTYAGNIKEDLQKKGIRVIIDQRNESLNKKIREGTIKKIPYLLVVGEKEVQNNTVAVRKYGEGDKGTCAEGEFIDRIVQEVQLKKH